MRLSLVALWLVALAQIALGQSPPSAVAKAMQEFVDKGELAGAVTVVGGPDGVTDLAAVGDARLEPKLAMRPDTLFRIASMTKPITAMAVLMLVEDGKIASVEDPVEKYLPEFQGQWLAQSRSADKLVLVKPKRPITLRDLLTHTSGLPSGYPKGLGDVYGKRDRTLADTTLAVSQQPLEFEPGAKWSYCNAGIDTLGRVVEVVSGKSYEAFLQARIFDPLGMNDTTFNPTAAQLERLASTYNVKEGKLVEVPRGMLEARTASRHPIPAGGLCSTGPDLAKLYSCLLRGGEIAPGKGRIMKAETLAAMTRTQTGDIVTGFTTGMSYGFGFAVVNEPQGVTATLSPGSYGHGGAFATQSWADPVKKRYYILLIQRTGIPNSDASKYRQRFQELAAK